LHHTSPPPPQKERWSRTFSLHSAVSCLSLLPLLLALLSASCRSSPEGLHWTMLHRPAAEQSTQAFPYPLIGVGCQGAECAFALSPK
jgi:hypothetical protein